MNAKPRVTFSNLRGKRRKEGIDQSQVVEILSLRDRPALRRRDNT
jgi:hypothetical protein